MNLFEGVLLGVLQGITEWLPISSSGQSILFLINLFNITPGEAFSISAMLHLGSLFAVVIYFRDRLVGIVKDDKLLLRFLILASFATALVGIPAYLILRDLFSSFSGEAVTMFIGALLIVTGFVLKQGRDASRAGYNSSDALYAGGAQGISVLPGVSRSGVTIAALLFRGVEQETALFLSFLLAIPAIIGLVVLEGLRNSAVIFSPSVLAGVVSSFFVSLASMHYLLALARKIDFSGFVIFIGSLALFVPILFYVIGSL